MARLLRQRSKDRRAAVGGDPFGALVSAHLKGESAIEVLERDDGYIGVTRGTQVYFQPFAEWLPHQRMAMDFATGRVLDIGAGAGRASLHLQELGLDVIAIDNSPLAIRVCKQRGVKRAAVVDLDDIESFAKRPFDTLLLLGGNFGLVQTPRRAASILATLHRITTPDARIIAESVDPHWPDVSALLSYGAKGRRQKGHRRRWAGELRMRMRFRDIIGAWFDYLLVSPREMERLLAGTGWRVREFLNAGGPATYVVLIEKEVAAARARRAR